MDGEVEKEDITEEEAKGEKKVTKGAQVCRTFCTAYFMFNSSPAWRALVLTLRGINFSMVLSLLPSTPYLSWWQKVRDTDPPKIR